MTYRTALITGASSGLGRGLAAWFARRGVLVYAAARRTAMLETLQKEVGPSIVPLTLDVADADTTHALVTKLDRESGGLDLVIANAGIGDGQRDASAEWGHTHQLLQVNVVGAVATLSAAIPGMVARGKGHLVGISSLAGLVALPRSANYCASKAFLDMWLEATGLDLRRRGLSVTSIQPGFVKTELTQGRPPGSLPFLLETDDAVERIGRAILRKSAVFAFPWQLASAARLARALPRGWRAWGLGRVRVVKLPS